MTTWPEPGSADDRIPLRELVDRHGTLSPVAALLVFRESPLELATAHEHGGAHRDFGPESVLVGHAAAASSATSTHRAGQAPGSRRIWLLSSGTAAGLGPYPGELPLDMA